MSNPAQPAPPANYVELRPAAELRSLGWFLRRTAIGLLALTIFVTGGAWLLHSSIESEAAAAQSQVVQK